MHEPVSKSDAHQLSEEYKATLKTTLSIILAKIKYANKSVDQRLLIKVGKDDVYKSMIGQEPIENRLTNQDVEQIKIALTKPEQLRGTVSIYIGKEKIFQVKDGKVLKDSVNMLPKKQTQTVSQALPKQEVNIQFDSAFREAKGKTLVQQAKQILSVLGKLKEDGSVQKESNYYLLSQKDNNLSITAKDGRGEVLNNNGFTEIATDTDIEALQKMSEVVENLRLQSTVTQSLQTTQRVSL